MNSNETEMFIVEAKSDAEAFEIIVNELTPFFNDGWRLSGNSLALADGWKNQYFLSKNGNEKICEFDLRPTLPHLKDTMSFTMGSMIIGVGEMIPGTNNAKEAIAEFKRINKTNSSGQGCMVSIMAIFVIFIIYSII